MKLYILLTVLVILGLIALITKLHAQSDKKMPYVAAPIRADLSSLSPKEREALYHIVKASTFMDRIFFIQAYAKNPDVWAELKKYDGKDKEFVQAFFQINMGPFDRLQSDKPFFGTATKPLGAGFYPADMTKEEFTNFVKDHPQDKEVFESSYTVIVRDKDGLKAVPYPQFYGELLQPSVGYLQKAAEYTENSSLKKYLLSRAQDMLSNNYFQSDCDWLDVADNRVEVVIGPYEVYEDSLFNYKAAYESFVYLNDLEESAKLQAFISHLQEMQNSLPVDKKYLAEKIATLSPLKIAQLVFAAGDSKAGVNTIAFALPNDEKVRELKGSKKILLKNIMEAKYQKILLPIAEKIIAKEQLEYVQFKPFLYHVLLHELSHPLGTDYLDPQADKIPVRKALKEIYSTIEEAKADSLGLFNAMLMIRKKVIPEELENAMFVTQLASMFRSMRFGVDDAHGGANLIQINFLKEKGGIVEKDGLFWLDFDHFIPALRQLVQEILEIQGTGDYNRGKFLIDKYGRLDNSLRDKIARLKAIPVDIKPEFETVRELGKMFHDPTLDRDRYLDMEK